MYRIGNFWEPTDKNGADYWTLDIDFCDSNDSGRPDHGAIIQIHGESLSQCLLKARFICITLNSEGMSQAEVLVKLLDMATVNPMF